MTLFLIFKLLYKFDSEIIFKKYIFKLSVKRYRLYVKEI